ncbi:MAG: hypothetical protein IKZ53_06860 [Selenomonadaceae bacterium]|nr:hypothetical protein [Selenomonadaceae bacterium]
MLSRNELRFERRSILTATQLRAIEKFPREFLRLKFIDCGDGIISGLDYIERDGEIILTEGLVKLGKNFFCAEEINLSELIKDATDGKRYKIILGEPQRSAEENVITEKISLEIRELDDKDGFELGRFKAGLTRLPKIDAEDLFGEITSLSRLNLLNVPYSTRGGATFHPLIFKAILTRLERKENPAPSDFALMIQLADFGIVSLNALKIFVVSKGVDWKENSREEILKSVIAAVDKEWEIILPEKISAPDEEVSKPEPSGGGFFIDDDY